jgi:hypothetical protein
MLIQRTQSLLGANAMMQRLGQLMLLVGWTGIGAFIVWGIEQIAERMGYRVRTIEEQVVAAGLPPEPDE